MAQGGYFIAAVAVAAVTGIHRIARIRTGGRNGFPGGIAMGMVPGFRNLGHIGQLVRVAIPIAVATAGTDMLRIALGFGGGCYHGIHIGMDMLRLPGMVMAFMGFLFGKCLHRDHREDHSQRHQKGQAPFCTICKHTKSLQKIISLLTVKLTIFLSSAF